MPALGPDDEEIFLQRQHDRLAPAEFLLGDGKQPLPPIEILRRALNFTGAFEIELSIQQIEKFFIEQAHRRSPFEG